MNTTENKTAQFDGRDVYEAPKLQMIEMASTALAPNPNSPEGGFGFS